MVQRSGIGDEVPIKVWRGGDILDLKATISENLPSAPQTSTAEATQARDPEEIIAKYGILVRSFSTLESSRGLTGVLVTAVDPLGLGAATIRMNDVIVAVNQNAVVNAQDFYRQFVTSTGVQATQITLIRENKVMTVALQSLPRKPSK
jgi:S1-C subfamily serine protease